MFDVQSPPAHPLNSQPLPKVRDRPTWPLTEDSGRRCPHEGWRNDRQEGYCRTDKRWRDPMCRRAGASAVRTAILDVEFRFPRGRHALH